MIKSPFYMAAEFWLWHWGKIRLTVHSMLGECEGRWTLGVRDRQLPDSLLAPLKQYKGNGKIPLIYLILIMYIKNISSK